MSRIDTFMKRSTSVTYGVAGIALVSILFLMTLRIVSRNLGLELAGLQLYAQILGVWMVFIVAGSLGFENRHIELDYLADRFPTWLQPYHTVLIGVLNVIMCVVIVIGSVLAAAEFWAGTSPSVNIPLPLYYLPAFIGFTLLAIVYMRRIIAEVVKLRQ